MKKEELTERVDTLMATTKDSLQLLWNSINKGQQKQIIKHQEIKEMFDRYNVNY